MDVSHDRDGEKRTVTYGGQGGGGAYCHDTVGAAIERGRQDPRGGRMSDPQSEYESLNEMARVQATEVERIWPTPAGEDPVLRQVAALTEEVGEIARAVLKRSHASRTASGIHKGLSVAEWTEEVALEIGQALGVLLGLAHQEHVDLDARMVVTLDALRNRPSIITPTHCQVMCETRRFGPMACGTRLPCDVHPDGVTEDGGRLEAFVAGQVSAASPSGRTDG